jgi:hypothetical protein
MAATVICAPMETVVVPSDVEMVPGSAGTGMMYWPLDLYPYFMERIHAWINVIGRPRGVPILYRYRERKQMSACCWHPRTSACVVPLVFQKDNPVNDSEEVPSSAAPKPPVSVVAAPVQSSITANSIFTDLNGVGIMEGPEEPSEISVRSPRQRRVLFSYTTRVCVSGRLIPRLIPLGQYFRAFPDERYFVEVNHSTCPRYRK